MSIYRLRVLLVLLASTICTGALQASALVATPTGSTLTCNVGATTTSSTMTVAIVLPAGGTAATAVAVSQSPASTLTITNPTSTAVNATSGTTFTWTITEPSGCKPAGSVQLTFTPTGGNTSAVSVTATLSAPTNSFLALSAGTSSNSPLLVYCNAGTGVTTGTANISAGAGATGLSSSNKLNVAVSSISVSVDGNSTNYSAGTLANSPVSVTLPNPASFYTGSIAAVAGLRSATCANLSQNSNSTTAQVTFTSGIGAATPNGDTVILYIKVTQQAPVTLSGAVTLQCLAGPSNGTPVAPPSNNVTISTGSAAAVNVSVTSSNWIVLNTTTGGPVTGAPTSSSSFALTASPASSCNGLHTAGQTSSGSIIIAPANGTPWNSVSIQVTLQVVTNSPLTATPQTLALTYRKGGPAATGTIAVTSNSPSGSYFTVIGISGLGAYITADTASGTAPKSPGTRNITFSTTSLNDTLSPGTSTYTIALHVAGSADYPIYVKVTVNDAAPVLSVAEGTTRSITWDPSTSVPSPVVTLVSSDTPIAYTITGMTGIVAGPTTGGLAFSYGTQINVLFNQAVFQSASPGQTLNGTLTVSGGGTSIPITFNVLVTSASTQANLGAISPGNLPTGTAGQVFTLNLYGSGFISSTTANYTTIVGLASSTSAANFNSHEPAISSVKVLNSSTIVMTLTVPLTGSDLAGGGLVNFNAPSSVYIGVCNPNGSNCTPSSAMLLSIGNGPNITSITSSSSFSQFSTSASGTPAAAPYDMISIFGTNFCNSGGTGCGSAVLMGTPVNNVYGLSLTPDGSRFVTVNLYTHPAPANLSSATPIAQAPLLFATNGQINALFPGDTTNNSALSGAISAGIVDIAVGFGASFSNVVSVAVAATDPGIFTIGSDGVGDAAALEAFGYYPLISSANPAVIRPANSDTVQVYMTGLGAPDTDDASCVTVSAYDSAASLQFIDGAVLQPSLMGGLMAPCFATPATSAAVKFGYTGSFSASPNENFGGWVTIPGLYAVNAQLPTNSAGMKDSSGTVSSPFVAPMQVNVTVGNGGSISQNGVTMWVAPQLGMAAFDVPTCGGTDFTGYSCAIPAVTGGSNSYNYAHSTLPANLSYSAGTFSSTSAPAVGSYMINVTATDATNDTLAVTSSFNIYITDPITQSIQLAGTTPTPSIYGVANPAVTTVSVVGGTSTYNYSILTGGSFASIDANGNVSITGSTPVGSNQVVVQAVDANDGTNIGTLTFYVPVAPQFTSSVGPSVSANGANSSTVTLATLSGLGTTGAIGYIKEQGPTGVSVNGSAVQFTGGHSLAPGTYSITVKGTDASSHVGFINLSLHVN